MITRRVGKRKADVPVAKTAKRHTHSLLYKIAQATGQAIGLTKKKTRPSEASENIFQKKLYGDRSQKQKISA